MFTHLGTHESFVFACKPYKLYSGRMMQNMLTMPHPVLWSFRRCPYAIRARMAVLSAGLEVELREIKLKEKPPAFLSASTSATVPNLQAGDLNLDESLDIMNWALEQSDPHGLLNMPNVGETLIAQNDGPFKAALDHTKYAVRLSLIHI